MRNKKILALALAIATAITMLAPNLSILSALDAQATSNQYHISNVQSTIDSNANHFVTTNSQTNISGTVALGASDQTVTDTVTISVGTVSTGSSSNIVAESPSELTLTVVSTGSGCVVNAVRATNFNSSGNATVTVALKPTQSNGQGSFSIRVSRYSGVENHTINYAVTAQVNPATTRYVKYNKNATDATGSMEDSAISSSGEVTLRTNGFSRSGYTFAGWATSADGSAQYTNGQRITGLTSLTSDLNLYAKWTANSSDDSSSRSSSSSSTSSGNSTTKVSTNSSGEKVTTTTTKQGTVTTVTQTTAKKDGSKEVVKTSTDSKTGKVTETKTTTKTDGSKEEVKTVTNKDGSKSVTETDTAADKSQAIVETEVTAAGDVTIVTSTVNSSGTKTSEATYTATDEDTVKITNIEVTGKTVTIPAAVTAAGDKYKVTRIGAGALKGNDKVTKVVIGKNIKAIGAKAFADTPKLKTIVLQGAKVKSIGKGAFDGINKKATIKIKGTAKQVKAVRKLIQKSGVAKTVKIKRVKK